MSIAYPAARIIASLANIAVAAMVVLSIIPFVTDQFNIDAPTIDDFEWSFSDGEIAVSAPIGISNGGFFDINDVVVTILVSNSSGTQIVSTVNQWGTIPSGGQTSRDINFSMDLDKMVDDGFGWMLSHSDRLLVKVAVSAKYTLKMIRFSADHELNIPWDGLVQDAGIGAPSLYNDTGSYGVQIPFYLRTADFLQGLGGNCSITLSNGTGSVISSASQDVLLGTNHSDTLSLALSAGAAKDMLMNNQTLTAEITVRLPSGSEITIVRPINWAAPMHW